MIGLACIYNFLLCIKRENSEGIVLKRESTNGSKLLFTTEEAYFAKTIY